jgi:hypothetical protein
MLPEDDLQGPPCKKSNEGASPTCFAGQEKHRGLKEQSEMHAQADHLLVQSRF